MKLISWILIILIVVPLFGEDGKKDSPLSLPENITLKNGTVIRKITIVRWEKTAVVVRHAGGVDPIRYESMNQECRTLFESLRAAGLAAEAAKKKSIAEKNVQESNEYLAKVAWAEKVKKAIAEHALIVGLTEEQAILSWGRPDKINASSSGTLDQWIYNRESKTPTYVYFTHGLLESWQSEN